MKSVALLALVFVCFGSARAGDVLLTKSSYSSIRDYVYSVTYTVDGMGEDTYSNYLVPITVKKGDPSGFDYALLKDLPNGKDDVRFFDTLGLSLSYDVVTWTESGSSTFNVLVPVCRAGTKIVMCWGQKDGTVDLPVHEGIEYVAGTNKKDWVASAVSNDYTAVRKNWWSKVPTVTKRDFDADDLGDRPKIGDFDLGSPARGGAKPYIVFYNRGTAECLGEEVPLTLGEYRAVVYVDEANGWGALEYEITFRIATHEGSREIGSAYDRILLMNEDLSSDGSQVEYQNYGDLNGEGVRPYWEHLDENGVDATTDEGELEDMYFSPYNFGGGVDHVYHAPDGSRLWYLEDIKYGNTFGNWYAGYELMYGEQNYLPWNPASLCFLYDYYAEVGDDPRLAGQLVMRNTTNSCVVSSVYTNGIGTIYFDAVNAFTNNIYGEDGVCNYQLQVEVDTSGDPDYLVDSWTKETLEDGSVHTNVIHAGKYGEWKTADMRVLRFDGDKCTDLGMCSRLSLEIADGGTCQHFYRVIVPVGNYGKTRFRIRRVEIDPAQTIDPDANAFILLDNIICSKPVEKVELMRTTMVPAFPSINDSVVFGRAKAILSDGSLPADGRISAATMHYRWHYIEQQTTEWKSADMNLATLTTINPLEVPMKEGDIEFWFDANQVGGYYEYTDYSGKDLRLGASGYSEERISITNGCDSGWYQRIREGSSDISEMLLLVKEKADGDPTTYQMSLIGDDLWSGHFRMDDELNGKTLWWRVEPRDRQTSGSADWNQSTNYWYVKGWTASPPDYPAAGRLSEGDTNSWSQILCDCQTGYLTIQVDSSSLGVTAIHSNHQDFNKWTSAGSYFSGSSAGSTNGVSVLSRNFLGSFSGLKDTQSTNDYWWSAIFDDKIIDIEKDGYKTFSSGAYKQWDFGKGMWVDEYYRDHDGRQAAQLAGCSEGYMEFSKTTAAWPRGLESLSFKARVAQPISPAYGSFKTDSSTLNNYTFMARTCFDTEGNKGFSGNAAISLFAYYRSSKGCYEARWEQVKGKKEENPKYANTMVEPDPVGQRLVISRWDRVGEGAYKETVLYAVTNSVDIKYNMPTMSNSAKTNNLMPFCISVFTNKNGTCIAAAVRITKNAVSGVGVDETVGNDYWHFATVYDNTGKPFTSGSYGVLTSNSKGMIVRPQFMNKASFPADVAIDDIKKGKYTNKSLKNGVPTTNDKVDDDAWDVNYGRAETFKLTANNYGFTYVLPEQTLDVYTCKMKDKVLQGEWELFKSIPVTGFGTPGEQPDYENVFYRTADAAIRLRTGGALDDYRTDVVVADVVQRQWRGYDGWVGDDDDVNPEQYGRTNFVFTTGWITNGAVRLSAKRTAQGTSCSIRSPLMDNYNGRGSGLGMMEITYREPSKNIRLKVQFVTNFTNAAELKEISQSVTEGDGNQNNWHTVTNLDYYALWGSLPAEVKAKGIVTYRFDFDAMYGEKGVMRISIDDDLVGELAEVTDPKSFGEIDIVEASCTDSPSLEKGCWWGWNLQTIGDANDAQRRMYLYDWDLDPRGRSMALNNSLTDGVGPNEDLTQIADHMPFVQSPTFTNAVIGEVRFKARKYDQSDESPNSMVVVYGAAKSPAVCLHDSDWEEIDAFVITNTMYETYSCKTDAKSYYAIRLGVWGVEGAKHQPAEPEEYVPPTQRVLIDEITVSEAVRAVLAFRNVGAFRSDLDKENQIEGIPCSSEQPLCGENWGVQAEVYATMLGDEIDKSEDPEVFLHWYVGKSPWGYENWKDLSGAKSAKLSVTESTNYVYRSSYVSSPSAIMVSQEKPGTVVQYTLEVRYKRLKSGKEPGTIPATNWLDSAAWSAPDWYAPVDYNSDPAYGAGKSFAAFNILDNVAPGWAWINEVNVLGEESDFTNSERDFQYVEICAPVEADMNGWFVRLLDLDYSKVITNTIATFGTAQFDSTKKDNLGAASNMVFRLIGNREGDKMKTSDGTLDGIWYFDTLSDAFRKVVDKTKGDLYCIDYQTPFGVQLVRQTGVIEHSIVTIGTNKWGRLPGYASMDPSNTVNKLNKLMPGSRFFYAAEDCAGALRSGSVIDSHGENVSVWTNDWVCTPGRINTNLTGKVQQINPDHPTANGDKIVIYASVDTSGGPIRQCIGSKTVDPTTSTATIILDRGSKIGTNIYYLVDNWYELASVTTNGKPAWDYVARQRDVEVNIGKGMSNNLTVIAKAAVDSSIKDYIKDSDPYKPAIMKWLVGGATLKKPFKDNGKEIILAEFKGLNSDEEDISNLTLTQMYWLDMDPTVSNRMEAGVLKVEPYETVVSGYKGDSALTNREVTVKISITNRTEGGSAWAPYALRGLEPGRSSWDYADGTQRAWSSETFKVTGILANGLTSESNQYHWVALRWFVFNTNSFDSAFTSKIKIVDPLSIYSPAASYGWYDWARVHGYTPVFNCWSIDERLPPVDPEILKVENPIDD